MKKGFYKLIPRVSSNSDYISPDTATSSVPPNEADIADIQEIQKAFLVDCCAEEDPGPERYAWLINKTEFVYRRRYMYTGKNVAAILQTIADRSALFFDYDPTAKNSFLNKRTVPNERVSKTTYDCIRDGVLEDFYQKLKTRRGQQFAQKSKNAARQLIDQIESERKWAKRSLFQWLYSDAHMKVPRQNYSDIKALYTQEDPDGKTPTPAQIRKRIRDDQSIYHIELLSDTVLHQDYSRLLGEAGDAAVLADSNYRSAFLIDVLLPLIQQFKYWQSWKEFPLDECDLRFHDITDFRTRMSDIQRLQERERELALNLKTRPYSLPFDYPGITLPDADCSTRLPSDIIDTMLRFYQEMGTSSINEQDKNILSGNISGVQASVAACSADARLPIILVLLIARYKRQLLNPIARMRAFGEERDYKSPYFGKSIAPSQQRLRYLNLLRTLCIQLEISEENTAHNLNDFVCFFGWQKMSDEELRQWRTLTWRYGYENIPAVGVSLRMYEYGMECLPASYFDLS